jgi:hypothetical protein
MWSLRQSLIWRRSTAAAGVQRIRILLAQHLLEPRVHLGFFDEFAPVGLFDALPHGGAEAGIFKQTQRRALHQMLGVCA